MLDQTLVDLPRTNPPAPTWARLCISVGLGLMIGALGLIALFWAVGMYDAAA